MTSPAVAPSMAFRRSVNLVPETSTFAPKVDSFELLTFTSFVTDNSA